MKLAKKICLNMSGRRLLGILFFSLFFSFTGIISKNAKAAETLSISNSGSATGSVNQNSAPGWGGQSFVAVDDNFSSVTWKVGTEHNDRYHDDFKLYLRNSSSETIASSTIHLDTPIQFTSGLEVNFALDTPYPTTPSTTYQFIIEISDEPFSYALTDGGIYNDGESLGSAYDMWFEIYTDSTPPNNDYVMYYGDNPAYAAIDSAFALPVVYNICDSWSTTTDFYLYLRDNEDYDEYADAILLDSCSGTIVFDSLTGSNDYSGTFHFAINELIDSDEFLLSVYTPLTAADSYIHYYYPNGLYIDTSGGAGTTTINFAYDVCFDTNWASSTIYLVNEDSGNTGVSITPAACNAAASLELPYSEDLQLTFPASISYQRSGVEYLSSSIFNIIFYSQESPLTMPEIEDYFGDELFPLSECESGNWWTESICKLGNYGIKTVNFFAKTTKDMAVSGVNLIKNIFPFNFANKFKESYELSETTELPANIAWLEIGDGNGNISITIPKALIAAAEDQEFTVWGPSVLAPEDSASEDFFEKISSLLKYLLWAGWIYSLWVLGEKAYNELRSIDNNND